MYSNNQQQQHQQQQQNLQPMQTFPKKMAKIKPMISQPSTESAEFIADDQLIKVRTPVRAVWRHKPIVHLLASSKESVSVEQVYISEDSGEPVAVCTADHASNPSPEAEELSVTEGSSFVIHTPSPSSSSSFVFQSQNNTQHAQKSDSKLPVQFYYHNDESESDYIVIHQANMESSQSRPNNEHSHHDETFIEDEECSGDDDLSEDELGEYIVTTSQNAPDDLLLDDEEDFYSSKKNKNSKQMVNYFMHDIQQSGDNDQSEYLLTEPEELFENALEENQTNREIVYDFPIFVPPFGYGYLETIFEEDEDNDEIIGAQHDTRYSSSDSSDGSNQNAIAESLDDQSFNSDEVFMHDNSCSPEPTVEQFEEKPNLESKKRIKKRNDSGIKSHSSNESFASSHSSTSKVESLNSFTIGPHHQSEEELLSPNEDFGPEARSAHRKLLIGYQQHPQSPESQFFFFNGGPLQTPSSVEHLPEHFHQHLEESSAEAQQFLIPPPSNLGFSGSSTDGDNDQVTVQLANGESSCEHDQRGESPLYSTSSTTTTGCLIAAAEAEINQAAQEVITPSPSISNSTTVTTTSPTPTSNASEQSTTTEQYSSEQYSYPTISMATATLTSAVLGGASPIPGPFLLPGDEYYLQQMYSAGTAQTVPTFSTGQHSTSILLGNTAEQAVPSEYRRKDGSAQRSSRKGGGGGGGHRHRRKGAINLLESGSDQASDIAPLDLSPDGGSTEDVSTGTPSTRSALSSDSEISRSDLSDDSDEETDRGTIRRRVVVDKNNNNSSSSDSNEKMQQQMAAQPSSNSLDRNVGPNFKLKTAKNIWSPSSSSLASPGSPPNAALLNSTENSDLYSDQISVNTQVPTHSTGEEGAGAGHLLSLHFVSSPSNDPQFAHLHHHNHNHYPQHYQHQHQQYSQQLPPQFAQAPLSLADYQAAQQQQGLGHRQQQHHHHLQLNHHSSEVVPPPYSSATYEQFEQKQQAEQQQQQQRRLQQYLAQHPTEPPALFSSSTLPRSMTIMESGGGGAESALHSSVPHVAEVYQPRQHPTHKYWTLPRSIATGIPLPNGGPYIERPGGVPPGMVLSEADDVPISAMAAMDDVDRFNKHHEQLQQTRIKEIAEQHMKPIHSTTTTTTSGTTVQEEIAHGTQKVSTSTTSKHIIQHVVARDEPPHGATLLYETEDATFYTVPAPEGEDELDQGMQATSSTTVKTTTYAVPKKKLDEGIGPVNESGVPITPKAGVKSEHGSEWYKAWVRNMHKMERAGRDDSADSICVKVKSPRYKGTDYQLTVEGKRGPPKYVPGNIADYVPGHSSISEREKQIKNGPELSGQPGTSSQLVAKAPTTTTSYYHEKCVFNTLTGQKQAPASVGSGSGYDSDSSYIIKKSKPKQSTTKPASPAVYRAVQRGEIDIPLGGLQRPAPPKQQPRRVQRTSSAAVYQPSQLNEGKINVQYRMPTNKLVAVDPMLDITAGSFTSTATGKNSGRYSYSGFMSPASMASTTVADSSFSTVVKQPTPTPRNVVLTSSLGKGPCGSEPYSMARHHYMPTAMSPVALDRYERAFADKENEPKKMARVIYDFHAQSRNELAVKKGDLVIVRKTVSLNWVEVEDSASGLVGLVPRSYLDFEQYGVARARYDFAAKTSVEISFKRGEKLTLLRRVDNNWYEGMNEKQDVGIFPVSYVEAIKQPIVLKSLEQQSACSPDSNAPHIHFSTDASREPGGGTTSQASSASSASLASIISIDNNRFGKADSYEHQYHHQHQHQQHQQHQQQLHSHPLHSTMMMTPSSMSPSPSGSMSISLGSLPQQYQSSSLSSVSSRPLPTPLCSHPPLSPVTANVPYHYSQQAQKEHEAALQKQAIYFSSTSSEPATYHHIRRAPEAIRHFGGCGERTCLPKAQIYRVIHPYKPQQIDEIELTYGDLLTVTTLCDDGWYLGRSTLSGKFGTFPGNYVEQV